MSLNTNTTADGQMRFTEFTLLLLSCHVAVFLTTSGSSVSGDISVKLLGWKV